MDQVVNQGSGILVEPLTRRERDILYLLGQDLSDREIAKKLVLALSSVKWYTRQIYAKLAVENRRAAVEKARKTGLLAVRLPSRPVHNLPRALSALIGREKEICSILEMIEEYPLVTLTGPGGVGKTRLALATAQALVEENAQRFPDGVWFLELAGLNDPTLVVRTLADVLRAQEEAGRTLFETARIYLEGRRTLLVLDNCEHLVEACAELAEELLPYLPELKILVTGREPLGMKGEAIFRVPSLALPAQDQAEVRQVESVRLFVERARAVLPEFELRVENAGAVARICRRLDGIPLALELAAARVAGLDLGQIEARLDHVFRLLSGGARNALPRHRTLRATVDWSYNLLADKERLLLLRLAVFTGGWTLPAAEAVCSGEGLAEEEILDLLLALEQKSMVTVERQAGEAARYRLMETIRQYAGEKLSETGDVERLRDRHLDWFVRFSEAAEPRLSGINYLASLKEVKADLDNLRAALEWSIGGHLDARAGLRIVNALGRRFWIRGNLLVAEGKAWIERGLAAFERLEKPDQVFIAKTTEVKALFNRYSHNPDFTLFDQALQLAEDLGCAGDLIRARVLRYYGWCESFNRRNFQKGLERLNESENLLREMGPSFKHDLAWTLGHKEFTLSHLHDFQAAEACVRESAAILIDLGDEWSNHQKTLGQVAFWRADYDRAHLYFEDGLARSVELEDNDDCADYLRKLGEVERARRQFERAAAYYRDGLRIIGPQSQVEHLMLLLCYALNEIEWEHTLPFFEAEPGLQRAALILGAVQNWRERNGAEIPEFQAELERAQAYLKEHLCLQDAEGFRAGGSRLTLKQAMELAING